MELNDERVIKLNNKLMNTIFTLMTTDSCTRNWKQVDYALQSWLHYNNSNDAH